MRLDDELALRILAAERKKACDAFDAKVNEIYGQHGEQAPMRLTDNQKG